jgi:hypothetical protein
MNKTESIRSDANARIVEAVRQLYQAFPYPNYPLFGKLRWEDGYAASSEFSGQLLEDVTGHIPSIRKVSHNRLVSKKRTILLGGSGEAQPYILRKLEPSGHRLINVDVSSASLRRARVRLLFDLRESIFARFDLCRYLDEQGLVTGPYDHVDLFGVLHHLPNPKSALDLIAQHMTKDGTMRVMVYNASSRSWIHQLQCAFRDMQLDAHVPADLETARSVLNKLARQSPAIRARIEQIGRGTFDNDARFADMFMHPREAKLSFADWQAMFSDCGLQVFGVYDRYGELDDLPNPLWQVPSLSELQVRAADGRFENNLELYLTLPGEPPLRGKTKLYVPCENRWIWSHLRQGPPSRWFSYLETMDLSRTLRWRIWYAHLRYVCRRDKAPIDSLIHDLPVQSARRLARLGAFLPGQIRSDDLRNRLAEPLSEPLSKRVELPMADLVTTPISEFVMEVLQLKANFNARRFHLVMKRLHRSQFNSSWS